MSASFVVVLPAIAQDLAERCVDSMCAQLRDATLLIDNTQTGEIAAAVAGRVGFASRSGRNLGVPRSWNAGVHYMRANSADYLVIVSQSITFGESGGTDFLEELDARVPPVVMHSQHGWKLIAINRDVFNQVGPFDETFSPAYYEDSEMLARMHRCGLPSPQYNNGQLDQIVIDAASAGDGLMLQRCSVMIDYRAQRDKFVAKWGAEPGGELFDHPYNDPSLPLTYVGQPPATMKEPTR